MVFVSILGLILMVTMAVDLFTPPCCRDLDESDDVIDVEDSDFDSDSDDDSYTEYVSSNRSRPWRKTSAMKKRRRLPRLVKKMYLKFWNSGYSNNHTCSVCLEGFSHSDDCLVSKEAIDDICSELKVKHKESMIDGDVNMDTNGKHEDTLKDKTFEAEALDFDAASSYSGRYVDFHN